MTIKETLKKVIEELKKEGIEDASNKARILLAHILKIRKEEILLKTEEEFPIELESVWKNSVEKLKKQVPLQYLIHHQEFMKLDFYVDEKVLIPQPDTEILVEEVIQIAKKKPNGSILDVCSGSGCIGISLAHYLKGAKVTLSDISIEALKIAKQNAEKNGVQVDITDSNLWENIQEKHWDIIVSNPPYIRKKEILGLSREVQQEPVIALDGGEDGLDFYRKIIFQADQFLFPAGYLALEIGYDQKEEVLSFIEQAKVYEKVICKEDLAGRDRVIIAKRKG